MDQFINNLLTTLPKTVIAITIMVLALLFFRQVDPPRTICDAQLELFRESQKNFLYPPAGERAIKKAAVVKTLFEECNHDNSPGGCFEYVQGLKKMAVDLQNVPEHCAEAIGEEPEVKAWLKPSLKLMVQMAWGSRAPASYLQKNGWFDASELTLFCSLRRHVIRIYGSESYSQWQEQSLTSLPGAEKLDRNQNWQRNILSTPCEIYK